MATKRTTKAHAKGKGSKLIKRPRAALAIGLLFVAMALGLAASYRAGYNSVVVPPALASQAVIAQAKQDITNEYLATSVRDCVDPVTGVPYDGDAYFNKYLQVNAYANRATIRPCNSNGELLAKLNGQWVMTEVNLNLSARANPTWANACWASDILTPDTVVRPENSSIDAENLKQCQALQRGQNLDIFGKEIKE
ncbi:MAG TPA: hypothetical protein VMB52_04615 [Verrucomicrobiae bacterium]|nr:hypothetical protein [Verrucomicrobiae bacterium]